MKGLTMAQKINFNQYNRSVVAHIDILYCEKKTGPILPPLVGHGRQARWLADKI